MDAWGAAEEFGRLVGLNGLSFESGEAGFALESGAKFGLLLCGRDILAHVVHPMPHPGDDVPLRMLKGAEARGLPGFALQVGARGSGSEFCVIGAVRVTEAQLSGEALMRAADQLLAWAESVANSR
jgi:hypothetical protein